MQGIKIRIYGNPPSGTSQQKGIRVVNGKPYVFPKKSLRTAQEWLYTALVDTAPNTPYTAPVEIRVEWIYAAPKSTSKRVIRQLDTGLRQPKKTRPDLDNLIKQLQDTLQLLNYIKDDCLISNIQAKKSIGNKAGLIIGIQEVS